MGGYQNFCMVALSSGQSVAGICHTRAGNADLPPVWLMYITVADLDQSMRRCVERGGKIRVAAKSAHGVGRYCVMEDPAGACLSGVCHKDAAGSNSEATSAGPHDPTGGRSAAEATKPAPGQSGRPTRPSGQSRPGRPRPKKREKPDNTGHE